MIFPTFFDIIVRMRIEISDDFDLYKIAYSGQCFRVRFDASDNAYTFVTGDHAVTLKAIEAHGGVKRTFEADCTEEEWNSIWSEYFDLKTSYQEIRKSIPSSDNYLEKCANAGAGIRILKQDKFEMLISFIISQRKSIPAIKSAVEKVCRKWGNPISISKCGGKQREPAECVLDNEIYSFPTAKELSLATEEELKECGLGYRVPYVMAAAKAVADGFLDLEKLDELSDEELLKALKSLYGVGDKVANCISLFGYHRIGAAPVDTWILKVMKEEYGGANPFVNYPSTAGIMQQYMFYGAQHMKNLN